MAGANLPAKMYKKKSPTELRLCFSFNGSGRKYIDIAAALSAINRRFYRQGVYYYVNSFEVQNAEDGYVDLKVAPDTWITKNAHSRAFSKFQEMNSQTDTPRPKYHDFKIFLNTDHRTNGSLNPVTVGADGNIFAAVPDDWDYSVYVSTENNETGSSPYEFNAHLVGTHLGSAPNYDSIGLIHSYATSRPQPDASGLPSLPSGHGDDPLNNLMEGSAEDVVQALAEDLDLNNDTPPYSITSYTGESTHGLVPLRRIATSPATGRTTEVSGACIPFGLLLVDADNYSSDWRLIINVAAGTYHGVYAERV